MPSPIDDEILQRYHDGDLSPTEACELKEQIDRDPAAQRRLRALRQLGLLVREAAAEVSDELDSDALFRAVEARLPQRAAPSLPPPPAKVRPISPHRLWMPALAATAVAAATLLVVLRSGEHDGGAGEAIPPVAVKVEALTERKADEAAARVGAEGHAEGDPRALRWPSADAEVVLVSTRQGSQLEHVDFGRNAGTAFLIDDPQVGITVVWLDDEDAP